jgi:KIF-1 binding protein C terminal
MRVCICSLQIAYELGETYLALLEMKYDKLKGRSSSTRGGDIDVSKLKKAEIVKNNSYCAGALAMFAHFTCLYSTVDLKKYENFSSPFESMPLEQLVDALCTSPDESLLSDDEIRPFLNCHFLVCRVLSKILVPHTAPVPEQCRYLVQSWKKYQWLSTFASQLCERKQVDLAVTFGEEHQVGV